MLIASPVVDDLVVVPTEQGEVVEGGGSEVGPVLDVVQCRSVKRLFRI